MGRRGRVGAVVVVVVVDVGVGVGGVGMVGEEEEEEEEAVEGGFGAVIVEVVAEGTLGGGLEGGREREREGVCVCVCGLEGAGMLWCGAVQCTVLYCTVSHGVSYLCHRTNYICAYPMYR